MSNALARPDQRARSLMEQVGQQLDSKRKLITALLPKEITPDRLKALTLTSLRKNPKLLECSAQSILACVFEAAKLGLQPDTATADCHLVPRKGQATFQLGYRGMMKLARRACPSVPIKAQHVRENDSFEWLEGTEDRIRHQLAKAGKRGAITHAYAIAKLANGEHMFKVVDADDIERAKKTAHVYSGSPWVTHEGAMWEKTAIKRLCKTLPIDDPGAGERMLRAVQLDDFSESGMNQDVGHELMSGDDETIDVCDVCDVCGQVDGHKEGCPGA